MLPSDLCIQCIHASPGGFGLCGLRALAVAEHPQAADAQRLSVGQFAAGDPDVPGTDAVCIFVVAVGALAGNIFAQRPARSVHTGLHRVVGDLGPGLDVAGLAVIAVAVGREVHHQLFVRHIYLNGADITLFAKIHTQPFTRLCTGGAPPAAAVLIDCPFRAAVFCGAGGRDRLFVAQQHPFRLLSGGIKAVCRDAVGVIGKVLVAVKHAVLVEPGRKQPHPALKVIVDGNAHGGSVPPVAVGVGNGTAVACTGNEATGLCGERIGCLPHKGAQRRTGGVYTVGVSVVLGARAGILQVIEAVMLCHKGTLDVGLADGVEHGSQAFGTQAGDICHLGRQVQLAGLGVIELLHGLVQHTGFPVHDAVVAGTLVA